MKFTKAEISEHGNVVRLTAEEQYRDFNDQLQTRTEVYYVQRFRDGMLRTVDSDVTRLITGTRF